MTLLLELHRCQVLQGGSPLGSQSLAGASRSIVLKNSCEAVTATPARKFDCLASIISSSANAAGCYSSVEWPE
jgi:hypothetical protein